MLRKNNLPLTLLALLALVSGFWLIYQQPSIRSRVNWQITKILTYSRGVVNPVGEMPTSLPIPTTTPGPTSTLPPTATSVPPTATPTPVIYTPTPTLSPTPPPPSISLPAPTYVKQGANSCGPASLTMYLEYYGWQGTQSDITDLIKPVTEDRNVNPEELVYYVRNRAGWLNAEFRVGGDFQLLKQLLAAGIPVVIETSFIDRTSYWPNDDRWAAHYLLLTGYDDAQQIFITQDSFRGANLNVTYEQLDADWKIFNRVYLLVYLPAQEPTIISILGENWDPDVNRQNALETAEQETKENPQDNFAWFNLGSNLVYFERYLEASLAYDQARTLGLPQRMLRYQFGPFFSYFHSGRTDDLLALVDYALQRTPNSEEALLWKGWGLYRQGDTAGAIGQFNKAYEANPLSQDVIYALTYLEAQP